MLECINIWAGGIMGMSMKIKQNDFNRVETAVTRLLSAGAGLLLLCSMLGSSCLADVPSMPAIGDLGEFEEKLNSGDLPLAPDMTPNDNTPYSPKQPAADFKTKATMLQLDGMQSYSNYVKSLHQQLRVNWKPKGLHGKAGGRTVVNFEIGKAGELVKLEVAETSGSNRADSAALDAVRHSAPFPTFPNELNMESMVIQYTFDFYKPF